MEHAPKRHRIVPGSRTIPQHIWRRARLREYQNFSDERLDVEEEMLLTLLWQLVSVMVDDFGSKSLHVPGHDAPYASHAENSNATRIISFQGSLSNAIRPTWHL